MKIIDLHNHTNFSYDGISGINSLVENAIRNHYGLDSLDEMNQREKVEEVIPSKNNENIDENDDEQSFKFSVDLEDEDAISEDFDDEFGEFDDDTSDIIINE